VADRANENAPKVFISHATADKERFVLDFATRLRNNGVDAWVDCWEMSPGDSLVEKIWNQGLAQSDAVIVVLSKFSIESRWVREELNTAFVKKVNGQIRLIPIRLDRCAVPDCLVSTVWKEILDPANYDQEFADIVNTVFGHSVKPQLGDPPAYVRHSPLHGLEQIDSLVLESACQTEIATGLPIADRESFLPLLERGITEEQIIESQEALQTRRLVKLHYTAGHHTQHTEVTALGFDRYANATIPSFQHLVADVGRQIIREEQTDNRALAESLNQPTRIISHILALLESKGWLQTGEAYGGGYQHIDVLWVSPELKRWLERL
jgi:hypothetical protein